MRIVLWEKSHDGVFRGSMSEFSVFKHGGLFWHQTFHTGHDRFNVTFVGLDLNRQSVSYSSFVSTWLSWYWQATLCLYTCSLLLCVVWLRGCIMLIYGCGCASLDVIRVYSFVCHPWFPTMLFPFSFSFLSFFSFTVLLFYPFWSTNLPVDLANHWQHLRCRPSS